MQIEVKRLDTPKQGVDVEELAQQQHEEFGSSREFDVDAVARACRNCCLDPSRSQVNCWIAYIDDMRVGYLAASIRPSFYSDRKYACQEMWYVVPQWRGSYAGIRLLKSLERWAEEHNCERIYSGVELEDDMPRVTRTLHLMNALGYTTHGYIAVKFTKPTKEPNYDRTTRSEVGAREVEAHTR